MSETGVLVGDNFSPKQLEAIVLFASGEYNCTQVAEKLDVSKQTISAWRRNSQFMDEIYNVAQVALRDLVPQIYQAAVKEALQGKSQHIKIILDHLDNLNNNTNKDNLSSITFTWDTDGNKDTV